MRLIGWVYDLNFTASLERLQAGGWLTELFDYLPRNDQTEHVRRKVLEYVESRLTTGSQRVPGRSQNSQL